MCTGRNRNFSLMVALREMSRIHQKQQDLLLVNINTTGRYLDLNKKCQTLHICLISTFAIVCDNCWFFLKKQMWKYCFSRVITPGWLDGLSTKSDFDNSDWCSSQFLYITVKNGFLHDKIQNDGRSEQCS